MVNIININHISLITLGVIIITSFSWLISRTLREGREAFKEINKD
tara:strand:+ start:372 stop:506 length:135 start_codon:yes stop_codon:yes gene_type:complete